MKAGTDLAQLLPPDWHKWWNKFLDPTRLRDFDKQIPMTGQFWRQASKVDQQIINLERLQVKFVHPEIRRWPAHPCRFRSSHTFLQQRRIKAIIALQ